MVVLLYTGTFPLVYITVAALVGIVSAIKECISPKPRPFYGIPRIPGVGKYDEMMADEMDYGYRRPRRYYGGAMEGEMMADEMEGEMMADEMGYGG